MGVVLSLGSAIGYRLLAIGDQSIVVSLALAGLAPTMPEPVRGGKLGEMARADSQWPMADSR